jgi:hypothetical protein
MVPKKSFLCCIGHSLSRGYSYFSKSWLICSQNKTPRKQENRDNLLSVIIKADDNDFKMPNKTFSVKI